jgi:hypothetical protein
VVSIVYHTMFNCLVKPTKMSSLVLALSCVKASTVSTMYFHPNSMLVSGTLYYGSNQAPALFYSNFSINTSIIPKLLASNSGTLLSSDDDEELITDYVYTYFQTRFNQISGVLSEDEKYIMMAGNQLTDFSLLFNFYTTNLMFFSKPPESVLIHILNLGTIPGTINTTTGMIDDVQLLINNTYYDVKLSLSHWNSVVFDDAICKTGRFTTDTLTLSDFVSISCSKTTNVSSVPILALRELEIGVHVYNGSITFYKSNNHEYDNLSSVFVLFFFSVYLILWIHMTRDLGVNPHKTWRTVSISYLPVNCDAIFIILSLILWARIHHNPNVYNITSVNIAGKNAIDNFVDVYTYGIIPFFSCIVLFCMAYGQNIHGEKQHDHEIYPWFSWGSLRISKMESIHRSVVFFAVCFTSILITWTFWVYGFRDIYSGLISSMSVLMILVYWSSAPNLDKLMEPIYEKIKPHDTTMIYCVRWLTEILILTTTTINMPYDINGIYDEGLHNIMGMCIAIVMLLISGRDSAILLMDENLGIIIVGTICIATTFVISHATIFGIGSIFGSSGALKGNPDLALLVSVTISIYTCTVSFVANLQTKHGINKRVE